MNPIAEDILMHYGVKRRSGRYPWGSGENPYQHSGDFLSRVDELKKAGLKETEIAKSMSLTTTQLRTQMSLAKDERRALQVATARGLREKGYSLNEIAAQMGFNNDSSVRTLLNEQSEERMNQAREVIIRDNGCDLGLEGYDIHGPIIIHHMNPINSVDIIRQSEILLNPEYLISTVLLTHNAIHYGDESLLPIVPFERCKNDTCPWRR